MKVTQIAELLNSIVPEEIGRVAIKNEDLTGLVDMGGNIESVYGLDNWVEALVDRIGRMVFVNRPYSGSAPGVLMDGWEYGSVLAKVMPTKLLEAEENESWELRDGASYDENIFTKIAVSAKFYNSKVAWEIPISIAKMQVKESFTSATEMNSFVSMIYTWVENSLTVKVDSLIRRTVNNFIGETVYADYQGAELNTKSGQRAINLLKLYNDSTGEELTAEKAIDNPAFIRYAVLTMSNYMDYLADMSTKYNVGGQPRFTPKADQRVIMLSQFKNAANVYLQSDTFHNEYTALPGADSVTYWQGTGSGADTFADRSTIDIKTSAGNTVKVTGVIAFIRDRNALGVNNVNRRVTSKWNAKAEFWNEWHKSEGQYFNDLNENGVVFFVA